MSPNSGYKLENGNKVVREYSIKNEQQYTTYLKPIYESKEYKEIHNPVLQVNSDKIDKITISPEAEGNRSQAVILDPAQITTFFEQLKNDLYSEKYESMIKPSSMSNIRILMNDNSERNIQFKSTYGNLKKWLIDRNLYEDAVTTANDIEYAVILANQGKQDVYKLFQQQVKNIALNKLIIKDKNKIQSLLDNTIIPQEDDFVIGFYFEDSNYPYIKSIADTETPDFVKNYFK
ncbi:DUF6449 domain-containing protein [Aquibacillus sp. 3ASR75-11]|uniref:DUF6449 domain-containing protein n=1 Tax=Terrihalobacillus insolitus TaxID=2950438 RepID=A0A9X3WZW5_9BACI|nr:DUF6449 domain-containing protein [Terrihalobacillus insolitus]MDC3426349.1 DUF6449 domain-containing protein [Terrihalobacillus insolitus]